MNESELFETKENCDNVNVKSNGAATSFTEPAQTDLNNDDEDLFLLQV
jgi:hypothetical protein